MISAGVMAYKEHNPPKNVLERINSMKLYHTGSIEIPEPDIYRGRKNADFG